MLRKKLLPLFLGLITAIFVLFTPHAVFGQTISTIPGMYSALGDSLAYGTGSPTRQGYVPRYKDYIQSDTGISVRLANLGVPGATSTDILPVLSSNPSVRRTIGFSQVVTLNVGGNDLRIARDSYKAKSCGGTDNQDCVRSAVATFKANWSGIIQQILSLRSTSNTIIRTMDLYNPYINIDKTADTWPNDTGNDFVVLKPYLDEVNNHIAATAASNNIPYAKVYLTFNGSNGETDPSSLGYISTDGFHPNDTGYQKIAELFRALGYSPIK